MNDKTENLTDSTPDPADNVETKEPFYKPESSFTRGLLLGLGLALAAVLIFAFGVFVGEHRAGFSFKWAKNYHRNFGGPMPHRMPGMNTPFSGAHGVFGEIIKKSSKQLVLKGADNLEKIIDIDKSTTILKGREKITVSKLKTGERIIVIGEPGKEGRVTAKLIRIFPAGGHLMKIMGFRRLAPMPPMPVH